MMIFDSFPNLESAERFAASIEDLETHIYLDAADAQAADPFPWELHEPVVHVARTNPDRERDLETAVVAFGGVYVGT